MKGILIVALVCSVSVVHSITLSKVPVAAQKNWDKTSKLGDIWTNCTSNSSDVKILSVTISPDPPKGDKTVDISATINFTKQVTGGSVVIDVKASIKTIDETEDLCVLAEKGGLSCPLSGVKTLTASADVPKVPWPLSSVHVNGSVKVTDQDSKEIACIDIDFSLKN